ncbi:MAG: hypothetical protein AB7F64_07845 [Gammaproteobacteria bacterium]
MYKGREVNLTALFKDMGDPLEDHFKYEKFSHPLAQFLFQTLGKLEAFANKTSNDPKYYNDEARAKVMFTHFQLMTDII